jgi:hypothetical protein
MATYYRLTTNASIHSQGQALWNGVLFFGAWYDQSAYELSGGALSGVAELSSSGIYGFAGISTDGFSGVYLTRFDPVLLDYDTSGVVDTYAISSSAILNNTVYVSGAAAFVTDVLGNVYGAAASGINILAQSNILALPDIFTPGFDTSGSFGTPIRGLVTSGTTLLAIAPLLSGIGTLDTTTMTSGFIPAPMPFPTSLAISGSILAVGGWSAAQIASGFNGIAFDPTNSNLFVGVSTAYAGITSWTNDASGNWSQSQAVTGSGLPEYLAWSPLAGQVLTSVPSSGLVNVFAYSFGSFSLDQVLAVSGAGALTLTDSTHALVCTPLLNEIAALEVSGTTWVASGTVALANPESILTLASNQAVAGYASGLAYLTLSGGTWAVTQQVALPFVPTSLALDNTSSVIAAGVVGASGYLYANGVYTTFAGGVSGMFYQQGQIVVADPVNSVLRIFSDTGSGVPVEQNTFPVASAPIALASNLYDILIAASGVTYEAQFTAPYTLVAQQSGSVATYNGAWSGTALKVGHLPEAVAFDASGNISAVTLQNELFTISVTGGIITSGEIVQFTGQPQDTPLGLSSLQWLNGHLYATSVLNNSLVEVQ